MNADAPAAARKNKTWRQRIFLILTVIVIVMLLMHPELRIFLPLLDALGLELLLAIMLSQAIEFFRPGFYLFIRHVARPSATKLYALVLFFFGFAGPYVEAWMNSLVLSQKTVARAVP